TRHPGEGRGEAEGGGPRPVRADGSDVVGRLLVEEALQVRRAVAGRPLAPPAVRVVRGLLVQRVVEDQRGLRLARRGIRGVAHASRVRLRPCRSLRPYGAGRRGPQRAPAGCGGPRDACSRLGAMTVDALTDVTGLRVGHATRTGDGALTGTTVVLAPEGGAVAAVDVRGGGPGTKETDALDPRNLVQKVEAIVLTGGSAYGLDAASGVMAWLEERGRGVRAGPAPRHVGRVVRAACVFDLGRGGDFGARPDAATGRAAVEAASASEPGSPVPQGCVGAGTGAVVGQLKGG